MDRSLSIQMQSPVSTSGTLPEQFINDWLPGSTVMSATGNFGEISKQSISTNSISMYYILAELGQDVNIHVTEAASFFFIMVNLSGVHEIISKNLIHKFSGPNHYSLLFITDKTITIKLSSQLNYKSIVLAYPISFIKSILNFFPLLDELTEKINAEKCITSLDNKLSATIAEKMYGLLHTPFVPLTEEYYLNSFREIAQIAFSEYIIDKKEVLPFNMHNVSCIHSAKEYIDTHLLEHLTIVQLARKAGINQLKLKSGFKAIYNIGVYGYQLQQRLLIAKEALEKTTKPVHQIARQAGYSNAANFSAAFKKVYSLSPYQHRIKMQ